MQMEQSDWHATIVARWHKFVMTWTEQNFLLRLGQEDEPAAEFEDDDEDSMETESGT